MSKILVVDDEKLIVKGLRFSLEQDGMEVDCAYDGEEAQSTSIPFCSREKRRPLTINFSSSTTRILLIIYPHNLAGALLPSSLLSYL